MGITVCSQLLPLPHLIGSISVITSKENVSATSTFACFHIALLPARASEQGNVIGLVSMYICIYYIYIYVIKKIVIERTRDLNYLKFVATDFSPKTISPSAGENSGDLA